MDRKVDDGGGIVEGSEAKRTRTVTVSRESEDEEGEGDQKEGEGEEVDLYGGIWRGCREVCGGCRWTIGGRGDCGEPCGGGRIMRPWLREGAGCVEGKGTSQDYEGMCRLRNGYLRSRSQRGQTVEGEWREGREVDQEITKALRRSTKY